MQKSKKQEVLESAQQVKSWNKFGETKSNWLTYVIVFILGFVIAEIWITPVITSVVDKIITPLI